MKTRMIRTLAALLMATVIFAGTAIPAFAEEPDYSDEIAAMEEWLDSQTLIAVNGMPPSQEPPPVLTADELKAYTDKVYELVNAERENEGLEPLERDSLLDEAAMLRASEIKVVDNAGGEPHTRPDGTSYMDLLDEMGVNGRRCGENLARVEPTPEEAVEVWIASDGHRKNILRDNYGSTGIGVYQRGDGKLDWIQIFMLQ